MQNHAGGQHERVVRGVPPLGGQHGLGSREPLGSIALVVREILRNRGRAPGGTPGGANAKATTPQGSTAAGMTRMGAPAGMRTEPRLFLLRIIIQKTSACLLSRSRGLSSLQFPSTELCLFRKILPNVTKSFISIKENARSEIVRLLKYVFSFIEH